MTEPDAGSETTRLQTTAVRRGDRYVVNGQKVWTSRAEHSDLLLLLARTTPYEELTDKTRGLSVFMVDLREAVARGQIEIRPIQTMLNHHTTELFITRPGGARREPGRRGGRWASGTSSTAGTPSAS